MNNVIEYLKTNKETYTRESLVQQLQDAGYSNKEIKEGADIVYKDQMSSGEVQQKIDLPNDNKKMQGAESAEDIEKNKGIASVAYFIWIIPLLTDQRNSDFVKFHLNQGFVLRMTMIIALVILQLFGFFGSVLFAFVPFIGIMSIFIFPLTFLLIIVLVITNFVFMIKGVISASNGQKEKLPIIGDIHVFDR